MQPLPFSPKRYLSVLSKISFAIPSSTAPKGSIAYKRAASFSLVAVSLGRSRDKLSLPRFISLAVKFEKSGRWGAIAKRPAVTAAREEDLTSKGDSSQKPSS